MGDIVKEVIDLVEKFLGPKLILLLAACFGLVFIWYQYLKNKLLREQLDIEKSKGKEFYESFKASNIARESPVGSLSSSYRILVVDDEEAIRLMIPKLILNSSPNVHVESASDGIEALEKIKESKPTVLITDILMPRMDGIQLLKTLYEKGSSLPTLVISGYSGEDAFNDALKKAKIPYSSNILFLQKPFRINELLQLVEKLQTSQISKKI